MHIYKCVCMFYAHVYTCIQLNVYFRFYIIKTSVWGLTGLGLLGKWITNSLKNEGFLTSFKSLKYFSYLKSILTSEKSNFSSSVMMNHTWSFWTIFFHLYRSLEMRLTLFYLYPIICLCIWGNSFGGPGCPSTHTAPITQPVLLTASSFPGSFSAPGQTPPWSYSEPVITSKAFLFQNDWFKLIIPS